MIKDQETLAGFSRFVSQATQSREQLLKNFDTDSAELQRFSRILQHAAQETSDAESLLRALDSDLSLNSALEENKETLDSFNRYRSQLRELAQQDLEHSKSQTKLKKALEGLNQSFETETLKQCARRRTYIVLSIVLIALGILLYASKNGLLL